MSSSRLWAGSTSPLSRQRSSPQRSGINTRKQPILNEECLEKHKIPKVGIPARSRPRLDHRDQLHGNESIHSPPSPRKTSWHLSMRKNPRHTTKLFLTVPRLLFVSILIALVTPALQDNGEKQEVVICGANAHLIRSGSLNGGLNTLSGRQTSPATVCTRWSHQSANVNGKLYIYGGQAKTEARQSLNTWNDNFLMLDLTKSWQITAPAITGLRRPSGPPSVAAGYLWHTHNSLFLYGGQFSDKPPSLPLPVSTWEYVISSSTWVEHSNPQTSAGNKSDGGGFPVQRAAEGAGLSVPELGKSWYFGGHLDLYTTPGWSNQIARVYLKSLLEFTHPGFMNTGVYALGKAAAGSGGVYRNLTSGGLDTDFRFTERADGVLVYIPGWGNEGIILGLAGGTNETFTEMNIIDVFDISSSTWYKQSTSGPNPPIRVNPCAVVAAAADGSSFNVYLYAGQNLLPYGEQRQFGDMWILTIPSFTWIQVDFEDQSQPPARAGHTCHIWDGQIVVVGGYVGKDISCDSPGVYVFDASSLRWVNHFTAVVPEHDEQDSPMLRGSLGYQVPSVVQSVIGGTGFGGATAIQPVNQPTIGPFLSGRPPTITVTRSGPTVIQTAKSTETATNMASPQNTDPNVATIISGVVAGMFFLLAAYLAFCSWLYRRQLRLYKSHVAMAQRTAFSPGHGAWVASAGSEDQHFPESEDNIGDGGFLMGPFGTAVSGHSKESTAPSSASPGLTTNGQQSAAGSGTVRTSGGSRRDYGRASEGDDQLSEYSETHERTSNWPAVREMTAHSSMEDLLSGQEPNFFSVVLNPRRTLRVVNSD